MNNKLFDTSMFHDIRAAAEFITNILQASTEYSIEGKDHNGRILLWNEGARRIYGYEPDEVVGKADSSILYTEEDIKDGKPVRMMEAARRDGKWEGIVKRRRKNGEVFTAHIVLTSFRIMSQKGSAEQATGYLLISKDITAEIQLTEQLKSSQFYTRSLIESNIDALITTDPLGYITDVNRQMVTLTGYTHDELIGSLIKNYFTEPRRVEEGIKLVLREGKVTNYELTALSKQGNMTVVSFNASTFRDAKGRLQGVFVAARDITEQKKLEQKLRESEAYNRGLIEASVDGLVTVDESMVITDVNETMCRMAKQPRRHLVGSSFPMHFIEHERAAEGVRITFKDGAVTDYVLTLEAADGQLIPVSFNAAVFRDAQGSIRGIFASARDITKQKELESELQESQFYTRSLIESNIDAMLTSDPLGIVMDVNQQMEALTGYTRDELIGSPFKDYFTDPERAEEGIRMALREGIVRDYELTARGRLGLETVVSYNATTFADRSGKLQGVLVSARDVTERKRFEQELQERTAEMERANAAKDRFLATMSHELRTPLNAIIGFTGTLLMKLPGPLTRDQESQLQNISTSAKHLLLLINGLLDLAKIESGKTDLIMEEVSCRSILEEISSTLQPIAAAKHIGFHAVMPEQDAMVYTDRRALSQILLNLTYNAVKFTNKGGVRVEMGRSRDGSRQLLEFIVIDTGIGIKPEDQEKLFQAFTQLKTTGAYNYEGTGLGLHISRKLAELLGGHITFESEYGKGSVFTLVIEETHKPKVYAGSVKLA